MTPSDGVCGCKGLALIGTGNNCTIINRKWNEFLYPANETDENGVRRQIFTWIPGGCDNQCNWQVETTHTTSGHKFRLKSLYFNEYFYAAYWECSQFLQPPSAELFPLSSTVRGPNFHLRKQI